MTQEDLMKSSSWDSLQAVDGFIEEGFPFSEGFPDVGPLDTREFEVIFRSGERLHARIDFSRQYAAEGLCWLVGPPLNRLGEQVVAAWCELPRE